MLCVECFLNGGNQLEMDTKQSQVKPKNGLRCHLKTLKKTENEPYDTIARPKTAPKWLSTPLIIVVDPTGGLAVLEADVVVKAAAAGEDPPMQITDQDHQWSKPLPEKIDYCGMLHSKHLGKDDYVCY